jgi:hypothetical protein
MRGVPMRTFVLVLAVAIPAVLGLGCLVVAVDKIRTRPRGSEESRDGWSAAMPFLSLAAFGLWAAAMNAYRWYSGRL